MTRRGIQRTQISKLLTRIEPVIPPCEMRQTRVLDRATVGLGRKIMTENILLSDIRKYDKCGWHGEF